MASQFPRHAYAGFAGLAAGCTVGTVGYGGAQILIPSLTATNLSLGMGGLSQLSATGVSLTSLSCSTLSTGWQFWKNDQVNLDMAVAMGIPAVLSARVGTLVAKRLSSDALALIFNTFSIVMMPTHFWIQERRRQRSTMGKKEEDDGSMSNLASFPSHQESLVVDKGRPDQTGALDMLSREEGATKFVLCGLVSGVLSAIMGVGGLPFAISFLTETTDLEQHMVQGTAVCAVIPSILTSAASRIHVIPWSITGAVCIGALAGGYCGAQIALQLTEEDLRKVYMSSLVLFGGRSMYGAVTNLRRIYVGK